MEKKLGKQSKDGSSLNKLNQIEIESSDSEYEGFVDIKSPSLTKGNDKGLADPKTGKSSLASLKSSGKTSLEKTSEGKGGKDLSAGTGAVKGFSAVKGDGKGYSAGKGGGKGSLPHAKPIKTSVTDKELMLELAEPFPHQGRGRVWRGYLHRVRTLVPTASNQKEYYDTILNPGELPPSAKLVMDCEASALLEGIQEHLDSLKDPKIKIPESFGKSLLYTKSAVHYTDAKSVKQALECLKEHGATDGEICMLANTGPETCEEAYGLIPSLKAKKPGFGGPLAAAIATIAKFKVSLEDPH